MIGCLGDFGAVITRLNTKGWTPEYWIHWQGEAETLDPAQSPADEYYEKLDHYRKLIQTTFPNCRLIIIGLCMHTNDYGGVNSSTNYPLIEEAQRDICSDNPDRVLLVDSRTPTQIELSIDEVHVAPAGYTTAINRTVTIWNT